MRESPLRLASVPPDWRITRLADACSLIKDGTHGTHERVETGIPLLSAQNVAESGRLDVGDTPSLISESDFRAIHATYSLLPKDVLVTVVGTIGRRAIVPAGLRFTIQRSVAVLRPNAAMLDHVFLFHFVASPYFQTQLILRANATAQAGVYLGELGDIDVALPNLLVQRRIANILTTVDNQIEKTEALIAKYQSIKQGLMHDLFTRGVDEHGRLRPTRDEAPQLYKESELGWIPNGWRVGPLSSVVQQILDFRGRTPLKLGMNWGGGDIPALSANNVEIGRINFDKETYYGSDALYRRWMTNGDAEEGDVLMTLEAPLGNVAQIPDQRRYILSQRVILIKAKKGEMSNDYLAMQLGQRAFQDRMRRESTGTTATGIQRARLIRLPLVVPDADEQGRIVSRIRAVVGLLRSEQGRLSKCRHLKLGLMQDLLTGKVPVKPEPADQDGGNTSNRQVRAGVMPRAEGVHA